MRCIPEEPDFQDGHLAEQAVWSALRTQLPDDVVLAHSVQLRHGRAEHEIDILVLWPGVGVGVAVVEVKGGRVSVDNGQWYQSDRTGKRRMESPVAQAQSAQHAFKDWIGGRLGSPLTSRITYMACFPYSDVQPGWEMAGTPRSLIIGEAELANGCAAKIRAAIQREGQGSVPLSPKYLERLLPHLSGDLTPADRPGLDTAELEDHQERLTTRQKVLLDSTRSITRARFVGGAGSGKTWLAVEKAKRLAKDGQRVGLFCYNKGLSVHLRREVAGWKQAHPVFVGEFHDYVQSLGVPDGSGQEYFDEEMPRLLKELADVLPIEEKLDAVVVDEGQDSVGTAAPLLRSSLNVSNPRRSDSASSDARATFGRRW